jgi:hypothetical protein
MSPHPRRRILHVNCFLRQSTHNFLVGSHGIVAINDYVYKRTEWLSLFKVKSHGYCISVISDVQRGKGLHVQKGVEAVTPFQVDLYLIMWSMKLNISRRQNFLKFPFVLRLWSLSSRSDGIVQSMGIWGTVSECMWNNEKKKQTSGGIRTLLSSLLIWTDHQICWWWSKCLRFSRHNAHGSDEICVLYFVGNLEGKRPVARYKCIRGWIVKYYL